MFSPICLWSNLFRVKLSTLGTTLTYAQKTRIKVISVVASIVCLVPFFLSWRLETQCAYYYLETDESVYYLPSEEWLVPLSLGYREAAAGIVWVNLLVYFGEQEEVRGRFEYLEPYLIGVTALDPYFYRAYKWGSIASLYNGTTIHRRDVEFSIEMLERGLRAFPEDGDLHYYLGFQYYFELTPFLDDTDKERVRRIGIDEICTASLLGGGPPYLPLMCSSLAERRGLDQLAQERLLQTLYETEDVNTRTRIEERLERLMTPDVAFRIMQRADAYRIRWRRELPYVSFGLYLLLGPKPPMPIEDEVLLPLPMDALIKAEEEELLYQPASSGSSTATTSANNTDQEESQEEGP